jgi:DNA-binding HxlR family transcriptional regulator
LLFRVRELGSNLARLLPICPAEVTLGLISGRWKLTILSHLVQRTMRFSDLISAIEGISRRILTQQLRQLEKSGLVHREVFAQVPPKVEYSLTELGKTLIPIIDVLGQWAVAHATQIGKQKIAE